MQTLKGKGGENPSIISILTVTTKAPQHPGENSCYPALPKGFKSQSQHSASQQEPQIYQ